MGGPMQRMTPPRGMVPLGPQVSNCFFSPQAYYSISSLMSPFLFVCFLSVVLLCFAYNCINLLFFVGLMVMVN